MKLIREMKVSDDNYGNTTKRIELNIPASKFRAGAERYRCSGGGAK